MNFEEWIYYDIHPFILFSNNGKIKYLNKEAEYFLSFVNEKEIFDFAINNARENITILNETFSFGNFEFLAALIMYNEDIGIKLYKTLLPKKEIQIKGLEKINIFMVLDFCRNYIFLDEEIEFKDDFDVDIPEFFANKNELIKDINSNLEFFKEKKVKQLTFTIKFLIGEKIKVKDKKYSVIQLKISNKKEFKEILIPFILKI